MYILRASADKQVLYFFVLSQMCISKDKQQMKPYLLSRKIIKCYNKYNYKLKTLVRNLHLFLSVFMAVFSGSKSIISLSAKE